MTIDDNPFPNNSVSMATLDDLTQVLLEPPASDDKATSEQNSASSKKVNSTEEKVMSNDSDALSKLDLNQDLFHKRKAVMTERMKKELGPQSLVKEKAEHTTRQCRKTIIVTICKNCYLLHCS